MAMAAALAVRGCHAPAPSTLRGTARLSRRSETTTSARGRATAALPCRGSSSRRLPRLVAAASSSSGRAGTATSTAGSAAMVLDHRLAGADIVAPTTTIESTVESVIFDFRFLALLAIAGSLAGSLLCFLSGCVYIKEAYQVYWMSCVRGVHTGQMVLRLVEAIDVYLAGTVMLIFGMGLYGLFISNDSPAVPSSDRALERSSLLGMFTLKERPRWMKISSLDELKTKLGHIIVMILLVKMFERSKMVHIATGLDLLSYALCIFLSSHYTRPGLLCQHLCQLEPSRH